MRDPLAEFTPERWDTIKSVLSGQHEDCISLAGAARLAGVSPKAVRQWVNRSLERNPEDGELIHEVADFFEQIPEMQAGRLEDEAWKRSVKGVKQDVYAKGEVVGQKTIYDNRLMMSMLKARDMRYQTEKPVKKTVADGDAAEIIQRLVAAQRVAEAKLEAEVIDVDDDDYGALL